MSALSGLSIDEAVARIERSNLRVGRIAYKLDAAQPENVVIGQQPEPGRRVLAKTPVDLTINRRPATAGDTASLQVQPSGFFIYRLPPGFLKKQVRVRWNSFGLSGDMVNELMEPGQSLWLMVPTYRTSTVFVYEDGTLVKTRVFGP
jgi:hypothetical protein